jgi:glycosyltransferase involved in cell wall biosynthesis
VRILIPILGFARTGGYRVLSELASAWIAGGHDVSFLVPDSSEEPYFPTQGRILWAGRRGAVSTQRSGREKPSWHYHLLVLFSALRRIGREYDVILANHSLTAWPVALARCGDASKLYYIQAYEPEYYAGERTLRGYILAVVTALTYHLRLVRIVNAPVYFRYRNLRATHCVPPGIDLSIFSPGPDREARQPGEVVIGCIGRREKYKGTEYVLHAFEALCQRDGRFRLRIAYGHPLEGWRHERSELVMPRNDPELAAFYRSLDILVAPGTVQHGAPHYPVLEAWACGIPVVTTGYMGASAQNAWMVKNADAASICEAVLDIVSQPSEARNRCQEGWKRAQAHAWDNVSRQMLGIFTSALGKG